MAKKKKTVVEKIVEAVDHVMHPDQPSDQVINSEADIPAMPVAKKSSQADIDFQSHPKFHKFTGKAKGAE